MLVKIGPNLPVEPVGLETGPLYGLEHKKNSLVSESERTGQTSQKLVAKPELNR